MFVIYIVEKENPLQAVVISECIEKFANSEKCSECLSDVACFSFRLESINVKFK